MWNKVIGSIGILWGAAILFNWISSHGGSLSKAHMAGQFGAALVGLAMMSAGLIATLNRRNARRSQLH